MWYLTKVRHDIMRKFPSSRVGQISKLCADHWNAMTQEQRLPCVSKAREMIQMDAAHYENALAITEQKSYQQQHSMAQSPASIFQHYTPSYSSNTVMIFNNQQQ